MAEWGNPAGREPRHSASAEGEPGELKHLSTRRTRNQHEMPGVAASETGPAQTAPLRGGGVVGPTDGQREVSRSGLERPARDGDSPVDDDEGRWLVEFLSNARLEEPGVKLGGPPSKAKDSCMTDSERVP